MKSQIALKSETIGYKDNLVNALLNSFEGNVALLNSEGIIVQTNEAWENYAEENGGKRGTSVGSNYFEVCKNTEGEARFYSLRVLNACESILTGEIADFEMEYPCVIGINTFWYKVKIRPLHYGLESLIIEHINIDFIKKTEVALIESENTFKHYMDYSPLFKWMSDENGNCIFINNTWLTQTNNAESKNGKLDRFASVHPQDILDLNLTQSEKEANQQPFEKIYRVRSSDGSYRHFMDKANPRFDSKNNFVGYIGRLIDVNELIETRDRLTRNQTLLKVLLDSTEKAFILISKEGKILMFNNLANEYYYQIANKLYSIGDDISMHILDHEHPEFKESFGLALKGNKVYKTKSLKILNDKYIHFSFDYIPVFNQQNEVEAISFLVSNITEKIDSLNKINESENRFINMADNTPVLIWMTNEKNEIVYVNEKLINYTGKRKEAIIGTSIIKNIHPSDAKLIKPLLIEKEKTKFETIVRLKHCSQEYRFLLLNASVRFTKNGSFMGYISSMVDITEMLNTKSALENTLKTVSNYKYALDQFALISITDNKGIIKEVNDKFCAVSKFSKSELLGCKHGILNSGFHDEDFFSEMKQIVHAGKVWRGEILNKAKDGTLFWVDASVVPLESTGPSKQFLSIYYEITDKKKAELELLKANNLISQASEIAKIGGWEYDILTETPEYSEQMYDFYGLPFGTKMTQELWIEPFLSQDREKIFYNIGQCIEEGKEWKEEYLFKNFKGKTLWIQSVGKKIINKDQHPKLIGIFKDITEQKELELQIIQKNDLLKESGKLSRLGGWSRDLKTNQITWTDMIYEIYGISKETEITPEIVMKPFLEQDQKLLREGNQKSIQTGEAYEYQLPFRNFNGELLWTKNIGKCIFVNGEPTRLIGVFQDITTQKELDEERNKLLEELVNKNKNLSQFTYIVSHNLRAPVANILGLTNLMSQQTLDPHMQLMVGHLLKSAKNLDGTFKDLNEILSLKEVSMEKTEISLEETFRSITSSLVNQIEESNVDFDVDFSEINIVFTIKIYLHSILYNLISNALKYRSSKRPLQIQIKTYLQKDVWIISVKDNGLGIDMERNKDKIFGLYKRFHQHVEGKGIGLYLIKTQAEAMGGHVKVFSELEKGTEFLIYLPNDLK